MGGHETCDPPWDNWKPDTPRSGAEDRGVSSEYRYQRAECKLEDGQEAIHNDQGSPERFFGSFHSFRMKPGQIVRVPLTFVDLSLPVVLHDEVT